MKDRFETITISKTAIVEKEGLEISAFIAGVNSGAYGLPFVIRVSTWAHKWWFKKFFYCEAKLNYDEVKQLRDECDKVIRYMDTETQFNKEKRE